jgi:ABC-2 type transport system permease protein
MSVFWALVNNDINIAKSRKRSKGFWGKFYFILGLLCGITFYTMALLYGQTSPEFLHIVPSFLLFAFFAVNIRLIKREWQGNTVGWWLSLPYSRKLLLGAKFTAGYLRVLRTTFITFIVSLLFWVGGMLLRPDIWGRYNLCEIFMETGKTYIMVLLLSPCILVFGMALVVLKNTKWSPATPLFWICIPLLLSCLYSTVLNPHIASGNNFIWNIGFAKFTQSLFDILCIIVSFIIAYLLFLFTTYLLERHVEV